MYNYIIPIYWVPDLRVRMLPENRYAITPICFSIDSGTGLILSRSFSYGLTHTDLHNHGLLAFRKNQVCPIGTVGMFRSVLGDLNGAKRMLETDNATLDLRRLRCPNPNKYDWSKAGALLGHFFYDWDHEFLNDLDNFRVLDPEQLDCLLAHVVERFNRLVGIGDIDLRFVRAN